MIFWKPIDQSSKTHVYIESVVTLSSLPWDNTTQGTRCPDWQEHSRSWHTCKRRDQSCFLFPFSPCLSSLRFPHSLPHKSLHGGLQHFLAFDSISHLCRCLGMEGTVLDLLRFLYGAIKIHSIFSIYDHISVQGEARHTHSYWSHMIVFSRWNLAFNFLNTYNTPYWRAALYNPRGVPKRDSFWEKPEPPLTTEQCKVLSKGWDGQIWSRNPCRDRRSFFHWSL